VRLRPPTLFLPVLAIALLGGFLWTLPRAEAAEERQRIYLGIDSLAERDFDILAGKRVGLLTHPAGVNRNGRSTVDILAEAPQVALVALFGPEHGVYGDAAASEKVEDQIDRRTGLPVYSLYGDTRKPTPAMLEGIDVMVVDLQGIGARSYTYISAMKLAMEACFQNGVEFVVLDRPNPLGGLKIDGPIMETRWMSYVGDYRIPYVHGLTIGELARMLKEVPGWLDVEPAVRRQGSLTIVPMRGWYRWMRWPQTGLRWVPTSPNIPDLSAVLGYAMTGLGTQIGPFRHGIGTPYPFRLLSHPEYSPRRLAQVLEGLEIPGLSFRVTRYQQSSGQVTRGVYVVADNYRDLRPTALSFHLMALTCEWAAPRNPFAEASKAEQTLFNKHVGSTRWWRDLLTECPEVDVGAFLAFTAREAATFRDFSAQYYLYQ